MHILVIHIIQTQKYYAQYIITQKIIKYFKIFHKNIL
jgi:hypothetical protein